MTDATASQSDRGRVPRPDDGPAPSDDDRLDVLGLDRASFVDAATRRFGRRPGSALAAYRRAFRAGALDEDLMRRPALEPVQAQAEPTSLERATEKFLLRTADELETESVVLPQRAVQGRVRTALCVSSQVGCAMGCAFCETAQMGRLRQLAASEIVGQWFHARHALGVSIDNVVFMGMGEPMDNLDAVIPAARILAGHDGPAVPARRITVSTVGDVRGIRRLARACGADGPDGPALGPMQLAVSVNAPNDAVRDALMPINRAMPMAELRAAMRAWIDATGRAILVEYVFIPGVNDELAHADELDRWLGDLDVRVNVIPYNPRRDSPWPAPDVADVDAFIRRLADRGRRTIRRRTLGRSVMAACGQLGNEAWRKRRRVEPASRGPVALSIDGGPAPG